MSMTFEQARTNATNLMHELIQAVNNEKPISVINNKRGRYIAALQSTIKAARNEGVPCARYEQILHAQLQEHINNLKSERRANKTNNYSVIKELSLGVRELVNSVKQYANATDATQKTQASTNITNAIGTNLKNIIKAPIAVTAKLMSTRLAATIMLAPISLGMGILHAAWTAMDSSPSPYDGSKIMNQSAGLQRFMSNIKKGIERI